MMQKSSSGSASYLQLRANKSLSIHTPNQSHQTSTNYSAREQVSSLLPTPSISKGDSMYRSSSTNHHNNPSTSLTNKYSGGRHQSNQSQNQIGSSASRTSSEYYNNKASELFHLLNRDVNASAIALNASTNSNNNNNSMLQIHNQSSMNASSFSTAYLNENKENVQMNSNNQPQYTNNPNNFKQSQSQQQQQQQETFRSRQNNNRTPIASQKSPIALSNRSLTPVSPTPQSYGKINGSSSQLSNRVYESMIFSASSTTTTAQSKLKHSSYSPNSIINAKSQYNQHIAANSSSSSKTNLANKKASRQDVSHFQSQQQQQQQQQLLQDSQDQNTSINISQLLNLNTIFTNPSVYNQQQQQQQQQQYQPSVHSSQQLPSSYSHQLQSHQQHSQSVLRQTQSQRTSMEGSVCSSTSSQSQMHNGNHGNQYNTNVNHHNIITSNNNNNTVNASSYSNNNSNFNSSNSHSNSSNTNINASSSNQSMLENCVIIQKQNEISGLRKDLRTAIAESTTMKNRIKVLETENKQLRAQAETERKYHPLIDEYVGKLKGLQFLLAHEKRVSAKVISETLLRNQNMSLILENLANIISIIQQKIDALASPPEKILHSIRESLNPILLCLVPVIEDIRQHNTVIQGQINAPPTQDGKQAAHQGGIDSKTNAKQKRLSSHSQKDNQLPSSSSTSNQYSSNSNLRKKNSELRSSTSQLQKTSQQAQQHQAQKKQQHLLSSRTHLQASNSSNNLSRGNHTISVDCINDQATTTTEQPINRPVRSASSIGSISQPPITASKSQGNSQLPPQQPSNSNMNNGSQQENQQYSQQQQQHIQTQQNNQTSSEIVISDSFYQQCLTNNSLRISESSYQSSTMKFPQNTHNSYLTHHNHHSGSYINQNHNHNSNLLSIPPSTFSKASPNRASTSNGLFEFSHSPNNNTNLSGNGLLSNAFASSALNAPATAGAAGAQYTMLGSFAKSKHSLMDDDCLLENLLEGVDITTTDETANNQNHPFNESQKIFNNTLKGLSETLKNLRYEDQMESSSLYNNQHQLNAIPSNVNSPFKPSSNSSNSGSSHPVIPQLSFLKPPSATHQAMHSPQLNQFDQLNQLSSKQHQWRSSLSTESPTGSSSTVAAGEIEQESQPRILMMMRGSTNDIPAVVESSSTQKEIEVLKNRILQRQSRRKLNSASVSPCNRSSNISAVGGANNNAGDFSSEHSSQSSRSSNVTPSEQLHHQNHHNSSLNFM